MAEMTRGRKNKTKTTRERKMEVEAQRGKAIRRWQRGVGGVVEEQHWAASGGGGRGHATGRELSKRFFYKMTFASSKTCRTE
jgi:hypothetical protein